jgi:hypothetical protein
MHQVAPAGHRTDDALVARRLLLMAGCIGKFIRLATQIVSPAVGDVNVLTDEPFDNAITSFGAPTTRKGSSW